MSPPDQRAKEIMNTNFIMDNLLKWDRGGYLKPVDPSGMRLHNEILSFLATINANLISVPLSDGAKMKSLNDFLAENFVIYVHFRDGNPIMAGLMRKVEAEKKDEKSYLIVPYQVPKQVLRDFIRREVGKYI